MNYSIVVSFFVGIVALNMAVISDEINKKHFFELIDDEVFNFDKCQFEAFRVEKSPFHLSTNQYGYALFSANFQITGEKNYIYFNKGDSIIYLNNFKNYLSFYQKKEKFSTILKGYSEILELAQNVPAFIIDSLFISIFPEWKSFKPKANSTADSGCFYYLNQALPYLYKVEFWKSGEVELSDSYPYKRLNQKEFKSVLMIPIAPPSKTYDQYKLGNYRLSQKIQDGKY